MIVGGQTEVRTTAIINYHAPFDPGLTYLLAEVFISFLVQDLLVNKFMKLFSINFKLVQCITTPWKVNIHS